MPQDVTYSSYLDLDRILSAQHPVSGAHDEMLFIIVHQASELWLKLCLHELELARERIAADDLRPAFKMLSRVARAQGQLIQSWDVLSTMTPHDYSTVRPHLGNSSGFPERAVPVDGIPAGWAQYRHGDDARGNAGRGREACVQNWRGRAFMTWR